MGSLKALFCSAAVAALMVSAPAAQAADTGFSMEQVLSYPYPQEMASPEHGDRVAWVRDYKGVRNVWIAEGPDFVGRPLTHYTADDGQEITQLTFSPDGAQLVFVRGGDHDENWPAAGKLDPDPDSSPVQPKVTIWGVSQTDGALTKIAEGDAPTISSRGQLAYLVNDQVWTTTLDGKGKPETLFFDRGHDGDLQWSPDGSRLAFESERGDHAFIGVFTAKDKPLIYLAPTTNIDESPRWSKDGARIAFTRRRGNGGPPAPLLKETPDPWSIWVADATTGEGHKAWQGPDTLHGSYPGTAGGANLSWAAGDRLAFTAELDNWPHLYSVPAAGGDAMLLTPGAFMVEHVAESRDGKYMVYDANTGSTANDLERRHLFRVPVDRAAPEELTGGTTLEWSPFMASNDRVAFIGNDGRHPPQAEIVGLDGKGLRNISANDTPAGYPWQDFIIPKPVTYTAPDGTVVHADLFQRAGGGDKPGMIFVHGGPPRQMMLGWHYMDYYSNGYAVNQYLAAHGFTVLAVNYRLGIGYGYDFQHPEHSGPAGSSEYQDVLAGAHYLQHLPGVDPNRIGIWGGSYGGLLTALALARNSDTFKAGVDFHGVHDWSHTIGPHLPDVAHRYEKGDHDAAMATAWASSPDADVGKWTSPVLLIQGDDDRNVDFHETVDLARRLEDQHTYFEEMVIPNEIHGFLRYDSWLRADSATAAFLAKELDAKQ
ncbi:MAG TPA: prolyl oligopeptidase family serine peptidase [Caulobacteraceae bacterium]|jgi:dipeptidyl aminopeptidase/acylaminoacyl peptidase|nr:prolyl oligopeptidase family serine peptidase [Caulobacteraceae bacterium]